MMKAITKPDFKVREVYSECVSSINNLDLRSSYLECIDILEQYETDFENKFNHHKVFEFVPHENILGPIGKKEMGSVYEYRMVNKKLPGNKYYNLLKSYAPYGKCPLCSVRVVDTLDHYLPKSKFPVFAVTPINLVPACSVCNKEKHVEYPKSSGDQTLHPYFDNVENIEWIRARLIYNTPVCFEYYVDPPNWWDQVLKERVNNHFSSFNLNELFSTHANEELRGIRNQLIELYEHEQMQLKAFLVECYTSRLSLGINSWQAVMYKALASDEWFCNGGFIF